MIDIIQVEDVNQGKLEPLYVYSWENCTYRITRVPYDNVLLFYEPVSQVTNRVNFFGSCDKMFVSNFLDYAGLVYLIDGCISYYIQDNYLIKEYLREEKQDRLSKNDRINIFKYASRIATFFEYQKDITNKKVLKRKIYYNTFHSTLETKNGELWFTSGNYTNQLPTSLVHILDVLDEEDLNRLINTIVLIELHKCCGFNIPWGMYDLQNQYTSKDYLETHKPFDTSAFFNEVKDSIIKDLNTADELFKPLLEGYLFPIDEFLNRYWSFKDENDFELKRNYWLCHLDDLKDLVLKYKDKYIKTKSFRKINIDENGQVMAILGINLDDLMVYDIFEDDFKILKRDTRNDFSISYYENNKNNTKSINLEDRSDKPLSDLSYDELISLTKDVLRELIFTPYNVSALSTDNQLSEKDEETLDNYVNNLYV